MELQKKKKEVRLIDQKQLPGNGNMTQNNVYVGSTTDLQRMLHDRINEKSTTIDQDDPDDIEED